MSWSTSDEAVFLSFLRLRVGHVDMSHAPGAAATLQLLANLMSGARYRSFTAAELVTKLYALKEQLRGFQQFIRLPGVSYDEATNTVTATEAYFNRFTDAMQECEQYFRFRLNGMPEYRAIRDIVEKGGVKQLDFNKVLESVL